MPSNSELLTKIKIKGDMPSRPLGFYVLVEVIEVETESAGGIYLGDQGREQSAEEVGFVRAVGPTAYHGWEGCKDEMSMPNLDISSHDQFEVANKKLLKNRKEPYQKWGLEIGDMVEFRAYEGKKCVVPGYERWRYIPDSHILGAVNCEVKGHKTSGELMTDVYRNREEFGRADQKTEGAILEEPAKRIAIPKPEGGLISDSEEYQ